MIENACPFAPGEAKPEVIPNSVNHRRVLGGLVNKKTLLLVVSLIVLTILYSMSYSDLNLQGSGVLYQDWYIVKMSFYSYIMSIFAFVIRENRRKNK